MADEKAQTVGGEEEEEPKIPVFTVLKNGAILKNIFIVNKPPPPPQSQSVHQESEEILIVGRHPDCHIVLTHPSVSRFHLQILSNPSSQKLSLTDLSSVHGTWISDKRIEPGVRVELRQGDTLRVGASSRLYRLHWIPLSHAYQHDSLTPLRVLNCFPVDGDFEALESLVPQGGDQSVDSSSKADSEDKRMYETPEIDYQVVNMLPIENAKFESTKSISEVTESLVCDDNLGFIGRTEIPSAPPILEEEEEDLSEHSGHNSSKVVGHENNLSTFWAFGTESVNLFYPLEDSTSNSKEHQYLQLNCVTGGSELDEEILESSSSHEKGEDSSPLSQVLEKDLRQSDISALLSAGPFGKENSSSLIGEVEEDNMSLEANSDLLVNLDGKSSITKDHRQIDKFSEPLQCLDEKEEDVCPAAQRPGRTDGQSSFSYGPFVIENSSLLVKEVLMEINNQPDEEENPAHKPTLLVNLDVENTNEIRCLDDERCGETEKRSVSPENHHEKRDIKTISSVPLAEDYADSFSPDGVLSEMIDDKENRPPQSMCTARGQPESAFCKSPPLTAKDKAIFGENIWARRGKSACAVQIQTERSREKSTAEAGIENSFELEVEIFTPDKENLTPNTLCLRSLKKKNELEVKLDDTQGEQEIYTPDKENFTPNTLQLRSLRKKGKLELTNSKSHRSSMSKQNLISNIPREDLLVSPGENIHKSKDLQERQSIESTARSQAMLEKELTVTKLGTQRMPFQSLETSAVKKSSSEASVSGVATKSSTSLACSRTNEKVKNPLSNKFVGEGKKGWTMVADTNTLLKKESRKALQLLQGLKGTHLIIPRMVIRELNCLKRSGSLFRKKTEACLVLEWIEECMVKTNWWIHVQSSLEDERLMAPTPPASPQSLFSENSWELTSGTTSSFSFLRRWSTMELVSPAAEDHILDCALSRKKRSTEQFVLLSNDMTLKINAMAEGLICETAQEFHESLVTPSSERFMWAGSCPRGHSWSYLEDVVLAENYNHCQQKKSSRGEGAKGLKLILLHNSHYGRIH